MVLPLVLVCDCCWCGRFLVLGARGVFGGVRGVLGSVFSLGVWCLVVCGWFWLVVGLARVGGFW